MGKSKDLASGNSAAYVEIAGDTMSGDLVVNNQVTMTHDNSGTDPYVNLFLSNSNTSSGIRMTGSGNVAYELQSQNDGNFALYDRTNAAYRIKVDSSGRVTMPNQPCFRVAKSAAASGNGTILAFNIIRHNVGGHYNTSTGRFTAPVAGSYYFGWQGISGSQTTSSEQNVSIFINGVPINDTRFRGYTSSSGHIKTVVQLSVNDYAEIRLANAHVTTYPDAFHNQFMGFLIG